MFTKLGLYFRTIKHLKPIQIRYRLWYMLRDRFRKFSGYAHPFSIPRVGHRLNLQPGIPKPATCNLQPATRNPQPATQFTFLNQSHTFEEAIDWNVSKFGKLWAYNLNYFDYLHQPQMTKEQGVKLIYDFIEKMDTNREGLEPYPISLRGINWIKFLSRYQLEDEVIDASLYAQFQILLVNLEYHLLGNHLLENGFSLLFGAYYFRDSELLERSKNILRAQLEEQILDDGGHFERSPMYHKIMLERLLDCHNLLSCNKWNNSKRLANFIQSKTEEMLGWLQQMVFKNGDVPHVNDSTAGIAATKSELESYARRLGLQPIQKPLGKSGYRKYETANMEMLLDIGKIGPDYQPAHAHSDTLSFILYADEKPVIIDTGVSTYEANKRRQLERSTSAHNTVKYGSTEQSEMWDVFRFARRAYPFDIEEEAYRLKARHSGYHHLKITHEREWLIEPDKVMIIDRMKGDVSKKSHAFFHLHHRLKPVKINHHRFNLGSVEIWFKNAENSKITAWDYSAGFNKYKKAYRIEVVFKQKLETQIKINT